MPGHDLTGGQRATPVDFTERFERIERLTRRHWRLGPLSPMAFEQAQPDSGGGNPGGHRPCRVALAAPDFDTGLRSFARFRQTS